MIAARLETPVSGSTDAARSSSPRCRSIVRRARSSSSIVPRSSWPSRSASGERRGADHGGQAGPGSLQGDLQAADGRDGRRGRPGSGRSEDTPSRSSSRDPAAAASRPEQVAAAGFQSSSRRRPSKRRPRRPAGRELRQVVIRLDGAPAGEDGHRDRDQLRADQRREADHRLEVPWRPRPRPKAPAANIRRAMAPIPRPAATSAQRRQRRPAMVTGTV